MEISFYKYQGTGNDFVMIDDRADIFPDKDLSLIQRLCDRKFGIGADGLILIRDDEEHDFEMVYFNADGSQSMCGNGARCAVAFAKYLGILERNTNFLAIDGEHQAVVAGDWIELEMRPVLSLANSGQDYFVNTGSPHHVRFVENVSDYPVFEVGKEIRYSNAYAPKGTNVNFVTPLGKDEIHVRTYERGVENETLSCGTGVTACALVYGYQHELHEVNIKTPGGKLKVRFTENADGSFQDIWLIGPAEQVFAGKIEI
ncbi:diaminopimelate epimerase [Aquiflexum gelatinilyticum]|uniref:Diaminopimelate epimerase n=1 Tax=Aquiflexum gelatinilyticum TaxID=2961943 RepID=A0A9X2P962_9BACT|nr:diaminopimelate epimerase [Aquiflexum gelatinilyticum]MCR9014410.1 diaminopimelate epimerase [Aquiflexum gelatinilyticum]